MSEYTGSVDEDKVTDLIRQFGDLTKGERSFVVTYHVAGDGLGRLSIAGRGISNDDLRIILNDAVELDAVEGSTR